MPEPKDMGKFCRQLVWGLRVQERDRIPIVGVNNIGVQNAGQKVIAYQPLIDRTQMALLTR